MILFIRSVLFYVGLVTIVASMLLGFVVAVFLPQLPRNRWLANWPGAIIWWQKITCGVRYEVIGMENIPAGNGVILSKHQSAWETFALQMVFPPQTWVLKRILMWIPVFGWGLALAGSIAIDRGAGTKALKQVIDKGTDRLKKGLWVVIFPEGTRAAPGVPGNYNPGGAMLAVRSGYPVVPVAHNAGSCWPRSGWPIRPGLITMVVGPAMDPAGLKPGELNKQVSEWIEARMVEIEQI